MWYGIRIVKYYTSLYELVRSEEIEIGLSGTLIEENLINLTKILLILAPASFSYRLLSVVRSSVSM